MFLRSPQRIPILSKLMKACQEMSQPNIIFIIIDQQRYDTMEAKSILPTLTNQSWSGRDYVFAEHGQDGILQTTDFMTMVRSSEWKLIHFLDQPFDQLFNLRQDPNEVSNLWGNPSVSDKKSGIAGRSAWMADPKSLSCQELVGWLALGQN